MFRFKQFTVRQDRTAMKVGTDGVLLGAWAEVEEAQNILDIGTGTGLIALMAAQKAPHAHIEAIEIEANACLQAQENIDESPWRDRIHLTQTPLQAYYPPMAFDCIICNPPFFVHSTVCPDNSRSMARHCNSLPHTELIDHVARLLKTTGYFYVILPVAEAKELTAYAQETGLFPIRITYIHPTPDKAPKRSLIKFAKTPRACQENHIVIEISRHQYTKEYIELTKDFYLYL